MEPNTTKNPQTQTDAQNLGDVACDVLGEAETCLLVVGSGQPRGKPPFWGTAIGWNLTETPQPPALQVLAVVQEERTNPRMDFIALSSAWTRPV